MSRAHGIAGLTFGLLMVWGCFGLTCAVLADSVQLAAPKDSELVALIRGYRGVFERLRQMVTEDMHTRSYFSESELGGIEPESRKREYKALLRLKKSLRVTVNYDGSVRFIFATAGISAIGPGWLKGIQFVPTGTKLKGALVKTLDTPKPLPAGVYLVEVEPEWFLLYQVDE